VAVVGDAYVVVRALTNRIRPDIEDAFNGLGKEMGDKFGKDLSDGMGRAINSGGGKKKLVGLFGKEFDKEAEKARVKLRGLTQAGFFAAPAFTALAGALGAVGSGLVVVGALAGAAAQGGIVILGAALFTAAQAAATLKLALSGVGEALKAGLKLQKGSAAQTKAIAAANERLKKANLALTRVYEDRPGQIQAIIRADEDAQRSAFDAIRTSKAAVRAYNDAQLNTIKVQKELTKEREDAIETLQQLRFEVEGGAISEKRARIEFEKAREGLQRVQDLPPNSRARQEAELAFAEAELNLRKAIDTNKDLVSAESKKTVEVAKLNAVAIKDTKEYKDAKIAEAEAGVDAALAIQDAERAKQDAAKSSSDMASGAAFKEIDRQLSDARAAVREAQKDLAEAKGGGGAADAFADAMKNLSPEAQKFVKYLMSIQGEFKKLKAAAGKDLFPLLETAIQNLVDNLFPRLAPLLQGTGKALGTVAVNISKVITKERNLKLLEKIWKNNDDNIISLGDSLGNLYEGFLNVLDAAEPLIDAFVDWIEATSGAWAETMRLDNESGKLDEKFRRIKEVLGGLGEAGGIFWDALKDIFSVIMEEGGAADILVGYLKDSAQGFKDFISAGKEDGTLKDFLNRSTENFTKVLDLIGNIVGELLNLGAAPGTGQFIDSLNNVVDTLGRIGQKLSGKDGAATGLGKFLEQFALLTEKLTDSGSIEAFFGVLTKAFEVLNSIFGNSVVQKILLFVGPIIGVVKGIGLLTRGAQFLGRAFKGVFQNIFTFGGKKDPFAKLRKGSKDTRAELKTQMGVDKKKQTSLGGLKTFSDRAKTGFDRLRGASATLRGALTKSTAAAKVKSGVMRGLGAAGRVAGAGMRAAGRGLGALFGGPLGIILLLLPLIIENWDSIVAFFKDLIPKLGKIFSDMWSGLTSFLGDAWNNIKTWFTETFIPGLVDFGKVVLEVLAAILFPLPYLIIKFWPEISKFFTETVFPWFAALPGKIMEFAGKIWNFLKDGAVAAWGLLVTWFTTVWNFYRELPGKVLGFAGKVWNFLSDAVKVAWKAVTDYFSNTLLPWIKGIPERFTNNMKGLWNFITGGLTIAFDAVKKSLDTVLNWVKGIPTRFTNNLKGLWDGIAGGLRVAWEQAKAWWNSNVGGKGFTIGGFKIGTFQVPKVDIRIPKLAEGGIIPARAGGTMALIGEAGQAERVEPLDANGLSKRDKAMIDYMTGGGSGKAVTVNVYPSAGMDERELANLVSRQLAYQMRRGAA